MPGGLPRFGARFDFGGACVAPALVVARRAGIFAGEPHANSHGRGAGITNSGAATRRGFETRNEAALPWRASPLDPLLFCPRKRFYEGRLPNLGNTSTRHAYRGCHTILTTTRRQLHLERPKLPSNLWR